MSSSRRFFRNNGLTLVLLVLFLGTYVGGQLLTGWRAYNDERKEDGEPPVGLPRYVVSPHFLEATAENWESEFLQMFIYVWITAFLFQKGSAESNDPEKKTRERPVTAQSPAVVRRGGLWAKVYAHSLSLSLALLFFVSFGLHACASWHLENEQRLQKGESLLSFPEHFMGARFWFESFQNWQSEFLAILSMVVLTIWLREKGSPESKDVAAPHTETGG